jgi:dTDP-4-dehydrorhamnose 3,5-epimerase
MHVESLEIAGVNILSADIHEDERGKFRRNFCHRALGEHGIHFNVAQANISENTSKGTLRGFHFQHAPYAEQKILTVISGEIFNVTVDLRKDSPTFLHKICRRFSSNERLSLLIPAGTANAFLTLDDNTLVHYYMSEFFEPESYAGFHYKDPVLAVNWPIPINVVSKADQQLPTLQGLGLI